MKIAIYILAVLITAVVAVGTIAARNWNAATDHTVDEMMRLAGEPRIRPPLLEEVRELPTPVQRYLLAVMRKDSPRIRYARIEHAGDFLLEAPDNWRPFRSVEYFTVDVPGFVWDARIRMIPGLPVRVRDAFVDGRGAMLARVGGLVTVASVHDTPDIASGALHRYLAETPWVPSALLPSAGVRWSAIDDSTARATLGSGGTTVAVDVHFGTDGLIERVFTPSRMRDVDGRGVPTPWEGRFMRYEAHDGFLIPMEADVAWLLPEGRQSYWRGRVTHVNYQTDAR